MANIPGARIQKINFVEANSFANNLIINESGRIRMNRIPNKLI